MGIKLNTSRARKQLLKAPKKFDSHAEEAVEEHTEEVFEETQVRVPKKTTALMQTGEIKENQAGSHKFSRSIWYGQPGEGDGVIDYAAAVHEILEAEHAPPTGAKFVEQPLIESLEEYKRRVAREMKEAVKEAFR